MTHVALIAKIDAAGICFSPSPALAACLSQITILQLRIYRDFTAGVAPLAHPAVLVDWSQSFHGHISDMAPPEQDLSWKHKHGC